MRRFVCASLALAGVLAINPFAVADPFTFTFSGLNAIATPNNVSRSSTLNIGTQIRSNQSAHGAMNAALLAGGPTLSSEIGFPLEALLYPPKTGIGSQEKRIAVVDLSGNGPFLMAGNSGDRDGIRVAGISRSDSSGKSNLSIEKGASRGSIGLAGMITTLAETPEPGSLFLLGTGLLGLALAIFWKSAKHPTGS